MDSTREPAPAENPETVARARFVTLTNRGLAIGLGLYGAVLLVAYLFHLPGFSGAWMGLCSGSGIMTPGLFFLILSGGPAIAYLYSYATDSGIRSDSLLLYRLVNGIFAIGGSFFLVFLLSLFLQVTMPFPPDELQWISIQGCLFFALWIGIRWQCSRHFAIPMRWIPTKIQALVFIGIMGLAVGLLFLSASAVSLFSQGLR
jgi:hypothetical protein